MTDEPEVIDCRGVARCDLVARIQTLCDLRQVADFVQDDQSVLSGVLLGVSPSAVIIDRWDDSAHRPAGDPMTIWLDDLMELRVP